MKAWPGGPGRTLGTEPLPDAPPPTRVVACLNIWNDRAALEATAPSWLPWVDAVLAVDGSYPETGAGALSSDGTREYLGALPHLTLIDLPGASQITKRNAYLAAGRPGDLLLIVDADEEVTGADCLRSLPMADVGWVRIRSPLYAREYGQPRTLRWQPGLEYRGRHHWLWVRDQLLATHQYGGPGWEHGLVPLTIQNRRGLGHSRARSLAKRAHGSVQQHGERPLVAIPASTQSDRSLVAREALWVLQVAARDDGLAPSRLHTAINRTTPHASLFFKGGPGPFGVGTQYLASDQGPLLQTCLAAADVVHFHVGTMGHRQRSTGRQGVVLHHHGTPLRQKSAQWADDARQRGALVLLSNLDLLTYAPGGQFLPNPVPVARYARLRALLGTAMGTGPFRVAHSPSKPALKGTDHFLAACARLRAQGYEIEPVLTTGRPHAEVLETKATCHAAFDSFSLGMQCSGIEAAAMGLPVLAGDTTVAERTRHHYGAPLPYTFANSGEELEAGLRRLMDDPEFYAQEVARVTAHVRTYHDEAAVALRYLDLLDAAFGWRTIRPRR